MTDMAMPGPPRMDRAPEAPPPSKERGGAESIDDRTGHDAAPRASMNAVTAYLFDLPGSDLPPGPRRCGRDKKTGDGKCMSFPGRDAPACPHHIKAFELAALEKKRRGLAVA